MIAIKMSGVLAKLCMAAFMLDIIGIRGTLASPVPPRTVFCSRGGLFTGLELFQSPNAGFQGGSVRLDVCCTTTVAVEGLGDLGSSCAQLGNVTNGDVEQPMWGGGLQCNHTAVVSDMAVESQGWGTYAHGVLSLHVRCTDRTEDSEFVIDHFALTFTSAGIISLQGFRRVVPPSPPPYTLLDTLSPSPQHPLGSVSDANLTQPGVARVRPVEYFQGCEAAEAAVQPANGTANSTTAQESSHLFFAADLQCQGLRHDRCGCIEGELRCVVAAGDLGFEAGGLVTEADMHAMKKGSAAPWCEDGDVAESWFLVKTVGFVTCLMLEPGGTEASEALCNAKQPAQRWRRADPAASWADSRLESALNPGTCLMLQPNDTTGVEAVVASCSTPDKLAAAPSSKATGGYVANSTTDVRYSSTLDLVPLKSALGNWFTDYTAVSKAVAALGAPLQRPLASRADAASLAAATVYAGRMRHLIPHCSRSGVVCNAMGRVVHFDAAIAAAPEPPTNGAQAPAGAGANASVSIAGIMRMPWLVSATFAQASVSGQPPAAAQLDSDFRLLRALNFSGALINGTLPGDWHNMPGLTTVDISYTALSGPLPLSLVVPPNDTTTAAASHMTIDITGLTATATSPAQLCSPFNLTNSLSPLPHNLIANGQPASLPVCEAYVSWAITLPPNASCAIAPLCGASGPPPSLAQRAQAASGPNSTVAQLACTATCDGPNRGSHEEARFAEIDRLQLPRYGVAAAHPASGVIVPRQAQQRRLQAATAQRAATFWASRRLLASGRSATSTPLAPRALLEAEAPATAEEPRVEMATLGLPATPAAARDLLKGLFSDVLTPAQIAGAMATTGDSSAFEVAPLAPAPSPAPAAVPPVATAPVAQPPAQVGTAGGETSVGVAVPPPGTAAAAAAPAAADTGGVVAVDASESGIAKDDDSLPGVIIGILVATACIVVLVAGYAVWRSQGCACDSDMFSVTSSKPADYLGGGGGGGSSGSRLPSDSRYCDIEPESTEDRMGYPQLSASMSFSNLREVVSDAVPGGGGARRPLWMSMDASGSLKTLFRGGRSLGSIHAASAADSRSPGGTSGSGATGTASGSSRVKGASASALFHDKGRFFAEFGRGSPAKSLLHGNGTATLLPSPRPKSSSQRSSNDQSSSDRKASLISASPDAKGSEAARTATATATERGLSRPSSSDYDKADPLTTQSGLLTCNTSTYGTPLHTESMLPSHEPSAAAAASDDGEDVYVADLDVEPLRPIPSSALPITRATSATSRSRDSQFHDVRSTQSTVVLESAANSLAASLRSAYQSLRVPAQPPASLPTTLSAADPGCEVGMPTSEPLPTGGLVRSIVSRLPWRVRRERASATADPGATVASSVDATAGAAAADPSASAESDATKPSEQSTPRAQDSAAEAMLPQSDAVPPRTPTPPEREDLVAGEIVPAMPTHPHVPISPEDAEGESSAHQKVSSWLDTPSEIATNLSADASNLANPASTMAGGLLLSPGCLEAEMQLTAAVVPAGLLLETVPRAPVMLDSATGRPCMLLRVIEEGSSMLPHAAFADVRARSLICSDPVQRAEMHMRAASSDVFPKTMPLRPVAARGEGAPPPAPAPAVCFSCGESLEETLEMSHATQQSPEDAAALLAALCSLLERLHVTGYTTGGLSPASFVRALPPGATPSTPSTGPARPCDWRLLCVHTMLQQGSTAEPVSPLQLRWCSPEQLAAARAKPQRTHSSPRPPAFSPLGSPPPSMDTGPHLPVADVASDMFSLGLIVYRAATGREYWDDYSDEEVEAALLGHLPMPHLTGSPARSTPALAAVMPMLMPLMTCRAVSRPLASETLATVKQRFPYVSEALVPLPPVRTPQQQVAAPMGSPVRVSVKTQPITMRFALTECNQEERPSRSTPAVRMDRKWVFPIAPERSYVMILCMELSSAAPVPVFPVENVTHVAVEAEVPSAPGGILSQRLDILADDLYNGGRGALLLVPWEPAGDLWEHHVKEVKVHVFAKVTGFVEVIKISKRVHIAASEPETSSCMMPSESAELERTLDLVQCAKDGGIHFEAHVPLSKHALVPRI
eukprot:jgi/Ulvmu1/1594/UM111_0022.1